MPAWLSGRALASHARGQKFESSSGHHLHYLRFIYRVINKKPAKDHRGFFISTCERSQPWPLPLLFLLLLLGGGLSRSFTFCSSFGGRLLLLPFWPNAVICASRVMERITAIKTIINTRFTSFITTCRPPCTLRFHVLGRGGELALLP
jgi:hypothetical protein